MENFIILSTQRTGSTLMVDILNQHPELACFGELAIPKKAKDQIDLVDVITSFTFNKTNPGLQSRAYRFFLDTIQQNVCKNKAKATGYKLMIDQMLGFGINDEMINDSATTVVKLIRRDLLGAVVSRVRSSETKVCHVYSDEKLTRQPIHINCETLERYVLGMHRTNELIFNAFPSAPSSIFYYDNLSADTKQVASDLYDFLNVDKSFTPEIRLQKISSGNYETDIVNFSEVKSTLTNSEDIKKAGIQLEFS